MDEKPKAVNYPSGTIDVTVSVDRISSSFISLGTDYVFTALGALPMFVWLRFPFVAFFARAIINKVLSVLTGWSMMQAFFMNTAIRKASQAADFVEAVDAKLALPSTATREEYENAEKAQMAAFYNFVRVTN